MPCCVSLSPCCVSSHNTSYIYFRCGGTHIGALRHGVCLRTRSKAKAKLPKTLVRIYRYCSKKRMPGVSSHNILAFTSDVWGAHIGALRYGVCLRTRSKAKANNAVLCVFTQHSRIYFQCGGTHIGAFVYRHEGKRKGILFITDTYQGEGGSYKLPEVSFPKSKVWFKGWSCCFEDKNPVFIDSWIVLANDISKIFFASVSLSPIAAAKRV